MKTEDIDKRISMPDVDAEWARFEREVIGKEAKTDRRSVYSWIGSFAIAASVIIVAGLFFLNRNPKETERVLTETAEPAATTEIVAEPVVEPRTELAFAETPRSSRTQEKEDAEAVQLEDLSKPSNDKLLGDQIAGMDIVPNSSQLGAGTTMRLRGITTIDDEKQPLVVLDGQVFEIPDSAKILDYDTKEQFANLLNIKEEDIESIVVLKDSKTTAKWGEKAKAGVIEITTKPSLAFKFEVAPEKLEGQIAGLALSKTPVKIIKNVHCRPIPEWYDSTLVLLNGKEDADFIRHNKKYMQSLRSTYERSVYFFQRNQAPADFQHYESDEVLNYAHLFKGRPINRVFDYQTTPFTPAKHLSAKELEERCVKYLRDTYLKGDNEDHYVRHFAPELFKSPIEERLFGILTNAYDRGLHQSFGSVSQDSHGIYVPFIRDVGILIHNWDPFGKENYAIKDSFIKNLIRDLKKTAKRAESSVELRDSIGRIAFMYGGEVKKEPGFWYNYDWLPTGYLWKRRGEPLFAFIPNTEAPSYWWGEVYYSTKMPSQREEILIFLHAVDKLYATDCPEILTNRRRISGIVEDENGAPMSGVKISPYGYMNEGVKTDRTGRFELWLPYQDVKAFASKVGYKIRGIEPTDSAVTIRMKEVNLNLIITPPTPRKKERP